jgi:GNAT superfamily N-acetyltransferase
LRIEVVRYDAPDAAALIEEVQQEYVVRYGNRDGAPIDPAEFEPPKGLFLVGYLDEADGHSGGVVGAPVVCGGWRSHGDDAEVKRMYVRGTARGAGRARAILAELERTARAAGHRRTILETGKMQPEAVALYRSSGYTDITPFGHYAGRPLSIHLGKDLCLSRRDNTNPQTPAFFRCSPLASPGRKCPSGPPRPGNREAHSRSPRGHRCSLDDPDKSSRYQPCDCHNHGVRYPWL